ncbi:aminotransferase class I/II-fold pyridoxal phosphate-dependent enzyme [Parvibaculum sp.]|uniref:aminotransferase class I/II-fold pyridoxal phosphate-dependent enzyme n=1 Tax=Parvibaculum sp. TaxID=2024848 RepID=UPI001B256C18|nr:aminotransferase class I/II-fold pyridoxal phosphate-dependent enzyme [Parvibaculum sp.]MBO6636135.1 aminotransferase class I/II-fold pyridoxal phosphate-dependent enzyme [Parvibaculum sp.]MBO6678729.1 aminotransferase class I/II-fold pyridoxal phosphate-dependent enzyme [Parvibaculum sp.]MBO6685368.1 aminotransferase class I/II-fold pyridoxal phosphate-dependent enzyme [Parvibaculum sp.]MBO6905573.1 aminotransferase class I/II-fold pyridoxal phosphate-dependent enzyme [Parvibaculum sp.]
MTDDDPTKTRRLSRESKEEALRRILEKRKDIAGEAASNGVLRDIPEAHYRFEKFAEYQTLELQQTLAKKIDLESPYFVEHDSISTDTALIGNRKVINFGTYNYLNLNGHPRVVEAAYEAMKVFGTSASASRLVSGERRPHRELEAKIAEIHGTPAAITFVSGHATNVSTIGTLLGKRDLILHDRLIHNSVIQGALLSGAQRQPFDHNDWRGLDELLTRSRRKFEKVLICVEGVYSMDGDIPPMPEIIEVARKHKALVMVDEAHSFGALGKTGKGVGEHFGLSHDDVDIWMGTLSKTLAGCGGYVAGSEALVSILKHTASGFLYSVGMPPPIAAASLEALRLMEEEPERVRKLQENGQLMLRLAQEAGLDTGYAAGTTVLPVITGSSLLAVRLSKALLEDDINVPPIIYPAVEERIARLRFFISSAHTEEQIRHTISRAEAHMARLKNAPLQEGPAV